MEAVATIDETGALSAGELTGPVPWWSFTKTVLAIATLRLVEQGKLALDDPIAGQRYTLRQLLRHEAGLTDYGDLPDYQADVAAGAAPWPVDRLLAVAEADRLRYEPGEGWAYSNIGYLKVTQEIERAAGLPLGEALVTLVLAPSGLSSARLATDPDDLANVQMGSAAGYHPGWVYHGLVVGTLADAARLLHRLATGRLLAPETLAMMMQGRALPQYRSEGHPDPAYGLGVMMPRYHVAEPIFGHRGDGPGSTLAVYARGGKVTATWTTTPSERDIEGATLARLV